MAGYCTPQDLIDRYGEAELLQLAPAGGDVIDAAKVMLAIADASGFVDARLRLRHTLPLAEVPGLLTRLTAAIARHELHLGGGRQPTDQVAGERDAAIAFLKEEAAGQVDLGIPVSTGGGA
ncbi:gp436 family protein [Plastoroseomonas hellenica]|uniref:gp436 family protein n=1 Tax=Plastoroseomonas hellenica TaxID=2687306 RepID=UPI001BA4456A|nr:DUF1320 domain-containing protein [Plastoroseomonas hellenica]MBR0647806.1 DUF1320 domain-containing protein [Plastoroseomonas hellenica]